MSYLSNFDKELLFDHCFGIADSHETAHAERLVKENAEARKLYETLKKTLLPLEAELQPEALCPDALVDAGIENA